MKKNVAALLMLSAFSSVAIAQTQEGALVYGPGVEASSVPGLSGVMTLVLALLIFAVTFRVIKRRTSGPLLSILGASLVAGLFSVNGGQLISDAYALAFTPLSNPNGGTVPIVGNAMNRYKNTSDVAQIISSMTLPSECPNFPEFTANNCSENLSLAPSDSCEIDCNPPPSDKRLKHDINYLGKLENGIKLYSFKYLWSDDVFVGVMAQDLLQDVNYQAAVVLMDNNYYAVNYKSLGLKMITLDQWLDSSDNIFDAVAVKITKNTDQNPLSL